MVDCALMYEIVEICFLWRRRGCNSLEQSGGVPMDVPESVDVSFLEQEVGAQWRSAYECTREYRCVTVIAGGCRKSEQSGGVHVDAPESKDVLCLEQEVVGGWRRGEECMWIN
jgi:hypothetical protein